MLEVDVFAEITGISGESHQFSIVAKIRDNPDIFSVIDFVKDNSLTNLTALSAKVLDTKPTKQYLASTKPFDKEVVGLADLYGIELIYGVNYQQLVPKIIDVLNSTVSQI